MNGTPNFITVVSGIPRSGTSLMMQMLVAGGFLPLVDNSRPPDPSNPRGYFEFDPVKNLRSNQLWLEQARGRAVKIIHFLLRDLPVDGRFQYRTIIMRRPIHEVVASQKTMLERQGRKASDPAVLAGVYQKQLAEAEDWLSRYSCGRWISVNYQDALTRPKAVAREVNDFLDCKLDVDAMAAVVTADLCHHRS
jgi:hypothetical protein